MDDFYKEIIDYIRKSDEKKVHLAELWDVFFEGKDIPAGAIMMGLSHDSIKRVIGLFSPYTGNLLETYDSLGDIPYTWDEDGASFEINDTHISVWYELNE
jgi:hypothetical protein